MIDTPTPRTDAAEIVQIFVNHPELRTNRVPVDFARQLERELGSPTDLPDANTTAHARINWWKQRCDDLNEQLAAGVRGAELIARMLSDERALADRLAEALNESTEGFGDRMSCEESCQCAGRRIVKVNKEALAAWKASRD